MILIAFISSLIMSFQDMKTKTIHVIPLVIFILSVTFYHELSALNVRQGLIISSLFICLKIYEFIQKKVYLGLGDVLIILTFALVFSNRVFYLSLCLSSIFALIHMACTQTKITPFVPSLMLSFWSVFIYVYIT
jgi:hypothetical protein